MSQRLLEAELHSPMRARIVAGTLFVAFCAVSAKGAFIAFNGGEQEEFKIVHSQESTQKRRADILDRNGERLATSVPVYSLYADPRAVWDAAEVAIKLKTVLPDLDVDAIERRLSDTNLKFVWLKREITPIQRQAVFDLGLEGIGFQEEARRFYPQQSLASHVIGFTDIDGRGLSGIEYSMDERLSSSMEPIRLTIDLSVQYSLEAELSSVAAESRAKSGAGIVLDSRTGEVLAMASWPTFDLNRRQDFSSNELKDRAAGGVYELGSVFKPLTLAAGLDYDLYSVRETFDVSRPITVGVETIHDDHPVPNGHKATPTSILAHSSNIGTVQIGLRLGEERHKRFIETVGLADRAPVELASSEKPLLPEDWSPITRATVSFGHGISVSPVAFAAAFSSFANNGTYIRPTILLDRDPLADVREPRRVMSTLTSKVVVQMMREAVTSGTGRKADIPGYRVAGKTGTAEKVINGVYDHSKNMTSFAAVFPADDPKYTVLIVLDEPVSPTGRAQSAAFNSAPAVGRVIERIAPILDVMPHFEDIDTYGPNVRTISDRRAL